MVVENGKPFQNGFAESNINTALFGVWHFDMDMGKRLVGIVVIILCSSHDLPVVQLKTFTGHFLPDCYANTQI